MCVCVSVCVCVCCVCVCVVGCVFVCMMVVVTIPNWRRWMDAVLCMRNVWCNVVCVQVRLVSHSHPLDVFSFVAEISPKQCSDQ